jgi:hypothetical protein
MAWLEVLHTSKSHHGQLYIYITLDRMQCGELIHFPGRSTWVVLTAGM